jgi:HPt (histidine-containing phosphotransfer) domain-containing protein
MEHNNIHLDLSYLKSISSNDQAFIDEMIDTFINDTPHYLEDIHRYYSEKDYFRLYKTVHKFAPTLIFVGAIHKNNQLNTLENLAKEESEVEKIPGLIDEITEYCNIVVAKLKTTLNNSVQ